ncbi:hypothetical protein CEXT_357371 [Caerostris extrusa]|uniref:Uncharacterized protein n=1 Tax=Caerostris extrusa TaxID=172846 RepID=A0AAV4XKP8_CAEEX|nr:hypothetical protein CEXT_357371 [Caerostris extrusa]
MRFCLSLMTESDVEQLFRTEDAAMSFLRSLLKWPYQSLFLRTTNQLWRFISKGNFIVLLYAIVYYKRNKCHFKYNELLIEFWNLCPPHLREGERRPF